MDSFARTPMHKLNEIDRNIADAHILTKKYSPDQRKNEGLLVPNEPSWVANFFRKQNCFFTENFGNINFALAKAKYEYE